jgi:hypothetical protein
MNVLFGCVGVFALLGVYMVVQYLVTGWALSYLWSWFIVPQFGAGELSIAQAIGISIVVSFLTYSATEAKDERTKDEQFVAMIGHVLRPIMALAIGWIVHQFA